MYARIATFQGVDPQRVEREADNIRSQLDSGGGPPEGFEDLKGVLMLLDRDKGESLGITLFATEEGMRRGHEALDAMTPEHGEGHRTSVAFYEVPLSFVGAS